MDIIKMRWPRCWWEGEGLRFFTADKQRKSFPLSPATLSHYLPPILSYVIWGFWLSLMWRRHFSYIGAHPEYLTLINNLGVYPDKLGVKTFFQFKRQILFKDNWYKNDFEKLRPLEELRTTELNLSSSPIPVYTTVHPINHTQRGICSKNNKIINNIHFLFYINFSD